VTEFTADYRADDGDSMLDKTAPRRLTPSAHCQVNSFDGKIA